MSSLPPWACRRHCYPGLWRPGSLLRRRSSRRSRPTPRRRAVRPPLLGSVKEFNAGFQRLVGIQTKIVVVLRLCLEDQVVEIALLLIAVDVPLARVGVQVYVEVLEAVVGVVVVHVAVCLTVPLGEHQRLDLSEPLHREGSIRLLDLLGRVRGRLPPRSTPTRQVVSAFHASLVNCT